MPSFPTLARSKFRPLIAGVATGATFLTVFAAAGVADAADTTVASDGFDRSTASGWGKTPAGAAWTVRGGSGSSTGSSAATIAGINPGGVGTAFLSGVSASDVVVRAAFVVPSASTNFYFGVDGRRQSDGSAYRSRVKIDSARKLTVELVRANGGAETWLGSKATSTTVSAGQNVTVELAVSGSSTVKVQGKAYVSGSSVPDWQAVKTDSSGTRVTGAGTVGLRTYVSTTGATTSVKTQAFSALSSSGAVTPPAPTPAPVPNPTTPPPTAPPTPAPNPAPSGSRGSVAVGSTKYPVPSGAIFVATNGSDSNAGTQSAPVKTVTKAITKVPGGGTIVIRGGTYHEYFIVPPGKNIFIQSYPSEAVWFDGASSVSGFTQSGNAWKVDNWTTQFDSSPTYVKGAADYTTPGWQFVNPNYPMAARPDQVWLGGVEQTQVGSLSGLKAGTFFVDYAAKRLYLGSNPSGKSVEASTLAQAVSLRAPGTTLRGLGFRRYADSVWMQGVITSYYKNMTLENIEVRDSATAGIGIYATDSKLNGVTIVGSGQIGFQSGAADNLTLNNMSVRDSNDQHFNPAPSAGGFKLHNTRGVSLTNSEILNSDGNQFWTDTSTYDITLANNNIINGSRYGIVLEISSTATVVNNVVANNAKNGIIISDTDKVSVWNNTLVNNGETPLALVQDTRRITDLSVYGHDNRRPQPDMSMPWITRGTSIGNNIYSVPVSTNSIFQAESWDKAFNGSDMVSSANGNVFAQPAGAPPVAVRWGKKGTYATQHKTLAAYVAATGYDKNSANLMGAAVNGSYQPTSAVTNLVGSVAQSLPAGVATKAGKAAGTKYLGAWR